MFWRKQKYTRNEQYYATYSNNDECYFVISNRTNLLNCSDNDSSERDYFCDKSARYLQPEITINTILSIVSNMRQGGHLSVCSIVVYIANVEIVHISSDISKARVTKHISIFSGKTPTHSGRIFKVNMRRAMRVINESSYNLRPTIP